MDKSRDEHAKIKRLIDRINEAGGDAECRYHRFHRMNEYLVREDGVTVFQEFGWLDNDWSESKLRLIRHQLEMMIAKVDTVTRRNAA